MPLKGQKMLYRHVPSDFPEVFERIGWAGVEKHYHAHAKTIKRWIDICGRAGLKKRRKEYVKEQRRKRREAQMEGLDGQARLADSDGRTGQSHDRGRYYHRPPQEQSLAR